MASLPVDNQTAELVLMRAAAEGVSVDALLQRLLATEFVQPSTPDRMSIEDFEAFLEQEATDGPSLPDDFSRADIYLDHD